MEQLEDKRDKAEVSEVAKVKLAELARLATRSADMVAELAGTPGDAHVPETADLAFEASQERRRFAEELVAMLRSSGRFRQVDTDTNAFELVATAEPAADFRRRSGLS